ncbi:hypothetical protein ABE142_11240 [Paenibacillus alvei]|uniref:hypothetical protein n=1 Tax=Paenibacillus alvei TaxID=44250 RepID=UPI003D2A338C
MRPMPEDGYPIVGHHESVKGLYLAIMHSAITLAPLISQFAAMEIIDNVQLEKLHACRLARFNKEG